MKRYTFYYSIDDIQREVEKRTSFLGKYRSSEQAAHLLDRLAFTRGESFLFDEYIAEAACEAYDYIKAFARQIEDGFEINQSPLRQVEDSYGVVARYNNQLIVSPLVFPIDVSGFTSVREDNNYAGIDTTVSLSIPQIAISNPNKHTLNIRYVYKYLVEIPNTEIQEERELADTIVVGSDYELYDFVMQFMVANTAFGQPRFAGSVSLQCEVQVTPKSEQLFAAGDIVEYTYPDGRKIYLRVEAACNETTLFANSRQIEGDLHRAIVYRINCPDWQDANALTRADRSLKEVLVNYVIYRWLETTLPDEAETYEKKAERHGEAAMLALNTERYNLKRGSRWF